MPIYGKQVDSYENTIRSVGSALIAKQCEDLRANLHFYCQDITVLGRRSAVNFGVGKTVCGSVILWLFTATFYLSTKIITMHGIRKKNILYIIYFLFIKCIGNSGDPAALGIVGLFTTLPPTSVVWGQINKYINKCNFQVNWAINKQPGEMERCGFVCSFIDQGIETERGECGGSADGIDTQSFIF